MTCHFLCAILDLNLPHTSFFMTWFISASTNYSLFLYSFFYVMWNVDYDWLKSNTPIDLSN